MLPEPALTCTVPSVHDGLPLDCRVYHPAPLRASSQTAPWTRRHAAVLAHPYAPLGGSFDDPVVDVVGATLLKEGYLLCTFNFRGAGHSAGKTSWTAKPERLDFQSVVAFLSYYIHHLDPVQGASSDRDEPPTTLDGVANGAPTDTTTACERPVLVIGGYSYGSLITAQLPPLETILEPFAAPSSASHEAQIRLRAASLAEQQNTIIRRARDALRESSSPKKSPSKRGVRVGGGDEGALSPRRSTSAGGRSRSVSRELEEKLHELAAKTKASLAAAAPRPHRHVPSETSALDKVPEESTNDGPAQGRLPRLPAFAAPRPAYLLLSPIPGLASHLVTLRVLPGALSRARRPEDDPAEAKLVRRPTLAVHGGADLFVLPYKAREWVARLAGAAGSRFRGIEVPAAGHFWAEPGVLDTLLALVREFASGLVMDREETGMVPEDANGMDG
ncbi:hypothetical protein CCM_08196 [Cordyceps militaris CM01]|uniref:Prolyl oligopeptidase n=1 Tax=Cordyceps militaris (strain CM01) TaxID=983644 RepID=G3JNC4_CORMM|nr:uncharacterized protein CCM_08196 [Cordyceps militaris CM01]EGX89943.1 hypothetical protein CCM_08196 [Cordyceps militaris CM01]